MCPILAMRGAGGITCVFLLCYCFVTRMQQYGGTRGQGREEESRSKGKEILLGCVLVDQRREEANKRPLTV